MRHARRLAWILATAIACYAVLGFFLLPLAVRSQLPKLLTGFLHRPATVGSVSANPFALSLTVRNLAVREKAGPETFLSVGELYVNVEAASLWKRGLVAREVRVTRPYVRVVRQEPGTYNFSDLLADSGERRAARAKASAPLRFAVGNIQLLQGSGELVDVPRGSRHTLADLRLTVPFVSSLPAYVETFVDPSLQATVDGKSFSLKGESKPFANSLETVANLELRDFDVAKYLEYLPFKVAARLSSARFDLRTHVSYVQYRDRGPTLTLKGDTALRDVVLDDEKGAPLLRLGLAAVEFDPVQVFGRTAKVGRVRVEGADARVARAASGRWNWAALAPIRPAGPGGPPEAPPPAEKTAPKSEGDEKPFLYQLDDIALVRAKLAFEDRARPKPFATVLSPVDLSARNVSNVPGRLGDLALDLATEASEALGVKASLGLAPALQSEGTVKLTGLRLAKYAPFYDASVRFGLKGSLDGATRYVYGSKTEGADVRLQGLSLSLSSLEARRPEEPEPFFRAPALTVAETDVDLGARKVTLGKIAASRGALNLVRPDGGAWNVTQLTPPAPPPSSAPAPAPPPAKGKKRAAPPAAAPPAWAVRVASLALRDYAVRVADDVPDDPVRLAFTKISVDASDLSTVRGKKGRLAVSAAVNKRGTLSAKGAVSVSPATADLAVSLKTAELAPFQPYFAQKLNALVTDGAVSAEGNIAWDGKAAFAGSLLVSGFSMDDAEGAEEIARFRSLSLTGVALRTEPLDVKVDGVALSDFEGTVTIERDGTLNLRDVVATEAPASAPQAPPPPSPPVSHTSPGSPASRNAQTQAPPPNVRIGTVTLQGGKVRFTDRHIQPAYSTTLEQLGGRVSGLTSEQGVLADVDLRASLDGYTPVEITGRVNPLQKDPFVDLKAAVQGMDLSGATPYSGKYLGYTIKQGKLFLNVRYHVEKRRLDSQNVVVFDRLTLGDKVESPDATKLPVRFGLSLLTDRKGQIHLDVPVDGNLDDPTFHVAKVIWNVIVNLLAKAATSPFSLLGSLFGGGEELGFVDFAPGSAALGPPGLKKVESLAKALHERPALRLEVVGRTEPQRDGDALKELLYERKLKAQKARELVKAGESVADVDELKLAPEETARYLALAYKAEKFPKPKNLLGFDKDLPPAEMEKLMRSHLQVGADDLRLLASQRAIAVRDAFAGTGLVEPGRIFLVEGEKAPKEKSDRPPAPRVEFALK